MPDPSQSQLSPEDAEALIHAQQHLFAAGDSARATKLYDFLTKNGHATADDQGGLHVQGWKPEGSTLAGTADWQKAIDTAATPEAYSADKGILGNAKAAVNNLGAGAVQLFGEPVAHPLKTANALLPAFVTPEGGEQRLTGYTPPGAPTTAGQMGAQATAMLPSLALGAAGAPEAEGAAQTALSKSGPVASRAMAPIRAAVGFFDGPPESVMTKAVKPGKNNVGWNQDVATALPQMKSAEQALGRPIASIDDALEATNAAKKAVWSQVQSRLQSAGQMGATIDGSQVADAIVNSIDKRTALQNPALAARVNAMADTYRRPMSVTEAEDFLQSNNKELTGYYARNKVSRAAAEADPDMAAKVAEGDALRSTLYLKLDDLAGPGVAQIKKAYGALSNVQKELAGRQMVFARQAPVDLAENMSYLRSAGKIATGNVLGGAKDIAIQRFLSEVNDTNGQISRAFQKVQPASPFLTPTSPRIAGLLPRGAIQIPADDASGATSFQPPAFSPDTRASRLGLLLPEKSGAPTILPYHPEMSPGEQVSALMHLLRQMQPKALPAKASPIQLPPPN